MAPLLKGLGIACLLAACGAHSTETRDESPPTCERVCFCTGECGVYEVGSLSADACVEIRDAAPCE